MLKQVNNIINSMDVKLDREDAESKALSIYKLGLEALDILVDLGRQTLDREMDAQKKKKRLRAVIFSISIFAANEKSLPAKAFRHIDLSGLLYELSIGGYPSAAKVLHSMNIAEAEVQKEILLSLPIVDKHTHDKEVSLYEAIEEIKLGRSLSGRERLTPEFYYIGRDGKYDYELHRIGKKLFALRQRKLSI
ncbi:hypothetical protein [Desulfospira joergensenii]|uniref:hypothetical protein n=1 Tax=Desulfospira joergensenii TaxID=53329 RepID=UPI0003B43035|nr:hypothetical protein [Desulfospira joergensenii]